MAAVLTWIVGVVAALAVLVYLLRRPLGRLLKRIFRIDIPPLPPGCG